MKAIVSLKNVETEIKTKVSPDTFEKLNSISPQRYTTTINHLGYLIPLLLTYKGNVKWMYARVLEDNLNSFQSQTPLNNTYLMSKR